MNPDPKWEAGPRVRVDAMRNGTRFLSAYNGTWTVKGEHGVHRGVFKATSDNGHESTFAGCAEGVVLP